MLTEILEWVKNNHNESLVILAALQVLLVIVYVCVTYMMAKATNDLAVRTADMARSAEATMKLNVALAEGEHQLHDAVRAGNSERVRRLVEAGLSVDSRGDQSLTPLHHAVLCGEYEMMTLLLEKGANPSRGDRNGEAPLHLAAAKEDSRFASTLIDHKADVNARKGEDLRPLHLAARGNHVEVARVLLSNDAEVDPRHRRSLRTPLFDAVETADLEIVKLLCEYGADVHAKDKNDLSVLEFARINGSAALSVLQEFANE